MMWILVDVLTVRYADFLYNLLSQSNQVDTGRGRWNDPTVLVAIIGTTGTIIAAVITSIGPSLFTALFTVRHPPPSTTTPPSTPKALPSAGTGLKFFHNFDGCKTATQN
jgi:hypothetical protein